MQTIPDSVLDTIRTHRAHLGTIIDNLRAYPARAVQLEKSIADNYCMGESRLGAREVLSLSACCVGKAYGGKPRENV
jgi:hypothetical protein